jgi:hypothetical protein
MWRRGERELFSLPNRPRGPFGEEPPPWYKRKAESAPSKYSRPVAFASGTAAFVATTADVHGPAKWLLLPLVLGLPAALFNSWWGKRARCRREDLLNLGEPTL